MEAGDDCSGLPEHPTRVTPGDAAFVLHVLLARHSMVGLEGTRRVQGHTAPSHRGPGKPRLSLSLLIPSLHLPELKGSPRNANQGCIKGELTEPLETQEQATRQERCLNHAAELACGTPLPPQPVPDAAAGTSKTANADTSRSPWPRSHIHRSSILQHLLWFLPPCFANPSLKIWLGTRDQWSPCHAPRSWLQERLKARVW